MSYAIKIRKEVLTIAQQQGIKPSEFQLALSILDEVAAQVFPRADWRVAPVRCTDCQWSRVKAEGETWRAIVKIDDGKQQIVLKMILRRCATTYAQVEDYWLQEVA